MTYPYGYELYKRVDVPSGGEKYVILSTFTEKPSSDDINDAFLGKPRYVRLYGPYTISSFISFY